VITPLRLPAQQPREELQRAQTYSWYVRASRADSIVASGRVRALTSDAVRIDTTNILFSDLSTLERRTRVGSGWRRGAITGSIIMGGFGAFVIAGLCGMDDSASRGSCFPLAHLGGVVLGASIGFPIGGMIGAAIRPGKYEWQTVWPARD
jgi:hypothetical protein